MHTEKLQFDDAIDAFYKTHDGGQDTRKGVVRAADYPDLETIPSMEDAALMVSLDIYRGIPVEGQQDVFRFGADECLAESAFDRMLLRAKLKDLDYDAVKKIERSKAGISYGKALEKVDPMMGGKELPSRHPAELPLTRALAVELVAEALRCSDGSGEMPYLYYVPEDTTLQELELPQNSRVASPDGTLVTLTQDGVFMPLAGGYHYQGDIRLTLTEFYELYRYTTEPPMPGAAPHEVSTLPPEPCYWNYFEEPYRAALFLSDGKKVPERSVDAACQVLEDGTVFISSSDASSDAFGVNHFNGIIIGGKSGKYHLKDLKIRFNGNGVDDFQGMGAGLLIVGDDTETIIEHADICNYGTVRSTMVAGGSAKIMVKHSRFSAHEGIFEDGWVSRFGGRKFRNAPWMGGFEGNCRSTNLLDRAEANYFESEILSEKWGVLSTDNNKGCRITAINSLIGITGGLNEAVDTSSEAAARKSLVKLPFSEIYGDITRDLGGKPGSSSSPHPGGYGTYSIGNTVVKFAGSTVVTADYANTCVNAAAKVIYCASTPENIQGAFGVEDLDVKPQNTVVYTDKVGVMLQRGNGGGGVTIQDDTVFHCGVACFSVKSNGSYHIDVDRSTLISESGMLLCMMDDDDLHNGIEDPASPTAQELQEAAELREKGLLDLSQATQNRDVFVRFSNMELSGDCYNASGYRGHITEADYEEKSELPMPPFAAGPRDSARNLEIRLDHARYNGAITTAEGHHIDRLEGNRWLSPVPLKKWYNIAFLECVPRKPYQAGVLVRLENGSEWNVPKTCYITALTVDSTSELCGTVFVNGVLTRLQPDVTYTGDIVVEPGVR